MQQPIRTACLVLITLAAAPSVARGQSAAVTFTRDVAPILYRNCVECHRPTMFAPMSLVTYEEARPWARAIKQRVAKREMPPWSADNPAGAFKNDPRLPQKDIDTIVAWVDGGATKGDERDLPAVPRFADGWTIGKPDAIFTMAEEFKVPAEGAVPYQYIRIPTNLTEDKWIQAIEIKPGNRAVVHHVIANAQPMGSGQSAADERTPGRVGLGGVTPNKPGIVYEAGVARLLPARSEIVLQMHYTTNGEPATDRTSIGVIYAKEPPKKTLGGGMVMSLGFAIPPGADRHEVRASTTLRQEIALSTMTPHMHVRGRDMSYIAHYPDGRSETLLSVPKYDFNWQITYELAQPKTLPKDTRLEVIAHFDNSSGNLYNPDPSQTVRWGEQTWEEMMIGFFSTIVDLPAGKSSTTGQQD
ncbi:MAG: thiol-disulfide isomerase [Acidobacteria bacterium]|nr:MAG: thiol-disulfide isomerase [Acidobacteriota bacterium]